MLRIYSTVAVLAAFALGAFANSAEPPAKPMTPDEARAKVAVAIAMQKARAAAAIKGSGCGSCRTDYAESRADAIRQQIPLVLFVNDCKGNGEAVLAAGAIPCRVSEYANDNGKPARESRIVVLKPKPEGSTGSEFWISETLKADADATAIKAAIAKAKAPVAAPTPPTKTGKAGCTTGGCECTDEKYAVCDCPKCDGQRAHASVATDDPIPAPAAIPNPPVTATVVSTYYYYTTPANGTCKQCTTYRQN